MPQPKKAARFGNSASHHNMMMANLTTELIRHGRITTTLAKAKTMQPLAERMVTFSKRGDLHARRQALKVVRDADVVRKLFEDVGPAFADRNGGYTRVLKLGPRKGDAAPMALIEFTEGVGARGEGDLREEPRRRWGLRRRRTESAADAEGGTAAAASGTDAEPAAGEDTRAPTPTSPEDTSTADAAELTAEDRIEADPAEVEARLAAEDESGSVEAVAEDAQTDADETAAGDASDDDERQ